MDLLSEYLSCEVLAVGGRRDGGVDGYVVKNDQINTIVQVKWHQSREKLEGVSVVRELAGTLLARGVPNGLLVTTRQGVSKYAKDEISAIENSKISGLGTVHISYKTYSDIIDMLSLKSAELGSSETYLELLHSAARKSGFDTVTGKIET